MNVQYALKDDILYVLEANPRASRTVPFVSKATAVQLAKAAARIAVGEIDRRPARRRRAARHRRRHRPARGRADRGQGGGAALPPVPHRRGPRRRHRARPGDEVHRRGHGPRRGVRHARSPSRRPPPTARCRPRARCSSRWPTATSASAIFPIKRLADLGFRVLATAGTAQVLRRNGVACEVVGKFSDGPGNVRRADPRRRRRHRVNTPFGSPGNSGPRLDGYEIRTAAVAAGIPCITTVQGMAAAVQGIEALRRGDIGVRSLQDVHARADRRPRRAGSAAVSGRRSTAPVPRAARPPVQRVVEVVGARPVDAYVELTLAAPEIAERAEPGPVRRLRHRRARPPRCCCAARSRSARRRRRRVTVVVVRRTGPAPPGSPSAGRATRSTSSARWAGPFPLPRPGAPALLVGGGYGAAALVGLAAQLRAAGPRVDAVAGAAAADRLCSVQELAGIADARRRHHRRRQLRTAGAGHPRRRRAAAATPGWSTPAGRCRCCARSPTRPPPRGIPSYVAVEESMACGIGVCMTCVLPVVGEDGRTRFSRSCVEGPVFGGDRVRFADVGTLPWDVVGADAMGVVAP